MTLVIICMLAALLTGCTGANNDNNVIPDMPNATSFDVLPGVSPGVPGYGNDGGLTSPMPDTNMPGYGNDGGLTSPMPDANMPGNGNLVSPLPTVMP